MQIFYIYFLMLASSTNMIYPAEADIVAFFKNLIEGLHPYVNANEVTLNFSSSIKQQELLYQPFLLSQSVMQLVGNIINLLPPKNNTSPWIVAHESPVKLKVSVPLT